MRCPSGLARSTVTDFLPRLAQAKYADSPVSLPAASFSHGGPKARESSPFPGRSTLITSAPRSARFWVAQGPASTRVRSRTRTPSRMRRFGGTGFNAIVGTWPENVMRRTAIGARRAYKGLHLLTDYMRAPEQDSPMRANLRLRAGALVIALGCNAASAVEPTGTAVEYYYTPLGHYFITASPGDIQVMESGGAGPGWSRTGGQFGVFRNPA